MNKILINQKTIFDIIKVEADLKIVNFNIN
jgi:hypothetical protein